MVHILLPLLPLSPHYIYATTNGAATTASYVSVSATAFIDVIVTTFVTIAATVTVSTKAKLIHIKLTISLIVVTTFVPILNDNDPLMCFTLWLQ